MRLSNHMMLHFRPDFFFFSASLERASTLDFLIFSNDIISLITRTNTFSTSLCSLAEVSRKRQWGHLAASFSPFSTSISLSFSAKSRLFPTRTIGTCSLQKNLKRQFLWIQRIVEQLGFINASSKLISLNQSV